MKIFVVIPGYNEEKYLHTVLQNCVKETKNIIYVDDGSTDRSAQIASSHTPHVLVHKANLGKGAALKTGAVYAFDHLNADAIVFMDADNQHDPKELPKFFKALEKRDAVFGVRRMEANMPLSRFLGNKFASVALNVLFGSYIPDIPSGYKALTRKGYTKIPWKSKGYEVETEIAAFIAKHKVRFAIVEIESIYHDLDKGMTFLDSLSICKHLLQWRLSLWL